MKNLIITLYLAFGVLFFGTGQTEINFIEGFIDLKENGVLVQQRELTKYSYEFEEEWTVDLGKFVRSRIDNYVTKSGEMIFLVRNNSLTYYKKEAEYLHILGCSIEGDLKSNSQDVFDKSKWIEIAEFVGENDMNFIFISEKQKVKNGEPYDAKWVRFDNNMKRTEQVFKLPSHGEKENEDLTWEFLFEKNGDVNLMCNYTAEKVVYSILFNVKKDGTVTETDLSSVLNIPAKSQYIQSKNSDAVKFEYIEDQDKICYQFINEDYKSATVGCLSEVGEKLWEVTVNFDKKLSLSMKYQTTRSSFKALNGESVMYYLANLSSGYGKGTVLDMEEGENENSAKFSIPNSYSVPSVTYLACMINPIGSAKNVIKEIQNSAKKEKELKGFRMGYYSTIKYELLWVFDGERTRIYRFDL